MADLHIESKIVAEKPKQESAESQRSQVEDLVGDGRGMIRGNLGQTQETERHSSGSGAEVTKQLFRIKTLLQRPKLTRHEVEKIRRLIRAVDNENLVMKEIGPDGARKYFGLLEGYEVGKPYFFPLPVEENDLEAYLAYDSLHANPDDQDVCAMEYISEPISTTSVNILCSKLKESIDFLAKIFSNEEIFDGTPFSYLETFLTLVEKKEGYSEGAEILKHFFLDDDRMKLFIEYRKLKKSGINHHNLDTLRKKLRLMDMSFFEQLVSLRG